MKQHMLYSYDWKIIMSNAFGLVMVYFEIIFPVFTWRTMKTVLSILYAETLPYQ